MSPGRGGYTYNKENKPYPKCSEYRMKLESCSFSEIAHFHRLHKCVLALLTIFFTLCLGLEFKPYPFLGLLPFTTWIRPSSSISCCFRRSMVVIGKSFPFHLSSNIFTRVEFWGSQNNLIECLTLIKV